MSSEDAEAPRWLLSGEERAGVLATIWATVDLDRALADIGLPNEALADDPHLGARIRLVTPDGEPPIALAEPATEGRLAGTLARRGEGPVGRYLAAPASLDIVAKRAAAAGVTLGRVAAGPFGRSVLVVGAGTVGPHLVIVEGPAGTIER